MEVHAHSHTPQKEKWTHYFWEFLMLFLAVFCGFLCRIPAGTLCRTSSGRKQYAHDLMLEDHEVRIPSELSYAIRYWARFCHKQD